MRKAIILLLVVSVLSMTVSGCFGSFRLTRTVYEMNQSLNDKFLQTIVMWAMMIVPVYGFSALIDIWILNLIEFWTGTNPLAMNADDLEERFYEHEGKQYLVTTTQNRYDVVEVGNDENSFALVFDIDSWYLHSNGEVIKVTEESGTAMRLYGLEGELLSSF